VAPTPSADRDPAGLAAPGLDPACRVPDSEAAVPPRDLLAGGRRIAVGGVRGGDGATTVAAGLGIALAARQGRVAALDAGRGEFGGLALRAGLLPRQDGVRELLASRPSRMALPELRRFLTVPGSAGLEILSGARDSLTGSDAPVELLRPEEIDRAMYLLEQWYQVVIIDTAPVWAQPAGAVALAHADSLVLVTQAAMVDDRAVDRALAAARERGGSALADGAVVAVVETTPARLSYSARRRIEAIRRDVHDVIRIPFDPALADQPARWSRLRRRTRAAFAAVGASIESAPL
jgi:MinD-like ATPase involved in chromosome partitioning or flagellar assembly